MTEQSLDEIPIGVLGLSPRGMLRAGAFYLGVSLLLILAETGAAGFTVGTLLAVLPVPLYLALALWLDRYEPEPADLLMKAFVWGAVFATFIALLVNTAAELVTGSALVGSVVSAPLVEETSKAVALLVLFARRREEFDNVTDGVVYATMVGLGFAMTENILYYGNSLADGSTAETFVLRGVMAPFAHPLFTALTGIGLGVARESGRAANRAAAPLLGLAGAVGLHAAWNLAGSADGETFLRVYLLLMVPAFAAVLFTVLRSLRREAAVLRRHLGPLVESGLLPAADLAALCTWRGRQRGALRALLRRGPRGWREQHRFHRTATELAFLRWRAARDAAGTETEAEARYVAWLGARSAPARPGT